jgi:hypothetical protein
MPEVLTNPQLDSSLQSVSYLDGIVYPNKPELHGNQFYEFAYKFVIRNTFINILAISVNHFRFY